MGKGLTAVQAAIAFRDLLAGAGVHGIEAILGMQDADGLTLSVVVDGFPESLRRAVHDCEWQLMQSYGQAHFDFRIIDRRGHAIASIVGLENYDIYIRGKRDE